MNLRYDNIETNKFHINVAVSGYIIADVRIIKSGGVYGGVFFKRLNFTCTQSTSCIVIK